MPQYGTGFTLSESGCMASMAQNLSTITLLNFRIYHYTEIGQTVGGMHGIAIGSIYLYIPLFYLHTVCLLATEFSLQCSIYYIHTNTTLDHMPHIRQHTGKEIGHHQLIL